MSDLNHKLAVALEAAAPEDVEFVEEAIQAHPDLAQHKVGCRPVAVRGIALPDSKLVVYVRATGSKGTYWYVLDRSRLSLQSTTEETIVPSELDAKRLVLTILKRAYQASP